MPGFLGKGDVYIDNGIKGQFLLIGNTTKFAIAETEADTKERISKQRDTYGSALDSVILPKPAKISLEIDEIDVDNMALALRGLVEVIDVPAGSVADVEMKVSEVDVWLELGHRNLSNLVLKDAAGNSLTELEDYVVNTRLGMVKFLSSGSVIKGTTVTKTYDYGQTTGKRVKGGRVTEIECALLLDGANITTGKDCTVRVFKCKLRPSSEVDFLLSDFQSLTLEGTLVVPEGQTEAYQVDYID
ncbi:phage tail tube protein [Desulfovulcanus sp.]